MFRRPINAPALRRRPPARILGWRGWPLALFCVTPLPAQTHPAPFSTTVASKPASTPVPTPAATPAPSPPPVATNGEKILPRGTAFIQPGDYVFILPDGRKMPIKLGPIAMIIEQR